MTEHNTNSEEKRVAKRLADAAYYAKNKGEISRRRALRYHENKEPKNKEPVIYRRQAAYYQRNENSKKIFCEGSELSDKENCENDDCTSIIDEIMHEFVNQSSDSDED